MQERHLVATVDEPGHLPHSLLMSSGDKLVDWQTGEECFTAESLTSWMKQASDPWPSGDSLTSVDSISSEPESLSTPERQSTLDTPPPLVESYGQRFSDNHFSIPRLITDPGPNIEGVVENICISRSRQVTDPGPEVGKLLSAPLSERKSIFEKRGFALPRLPLPIGQIRACAPKTAWDVRESLSEDFIIDEMLGKGAMSTVYQARLRKDGRPAALKMMHSSSLGKQHKAQKEFKTLQKLDHPNIIKAFDFLNVGGRAVLVLEYYPGVNLETAVRKCSKGPLQEAIVHRLSHSLWFALEFLAAKGILHRDIKPENILISTEYDDLKLIDFNVATTTEEQLFTPRTGDPRYLAPEVLSNSDYSAVSDIYSSGLCMYFMFAAELPNDDCRHSEVSLWKNCWEVVSESGKSMVRWCLTPEACDRPTATQLLNAPWILTQLGDKIASNECIAN